MTWFRKQRDSADPPAGNDPRSQGHPQDPAEVFVVTDRVVSPFVVMVHDPAGFRAEQFRGLRNKLLAMNPDGAAKTLVITSAIKGEGKTVTAINLAMAFAEMERTPILLVDADLRSRAIEGALGLDPAPGVADLLMGRVGLDRAIRPAGWRNLSLLGPGSRIAGPSEVLSTPRVDELFARLKERFQYVILDTPPILAATDAGVLAAQADGTVVVVRLEHSARTHSKDAIRQIQDLGANVLGTFVTEVRGADPDADPRLGYPVRAEE